MFRHKRLPPLTAEKRERLEARVRLIDLARVTRIPVSRLSEAETGRYRLSKDQQRRRTTALRQLRTREAPA